MLRLRDQFARWLLSTGKKEFSLTEGLCFDLSVKVAYKKLAINSAINKMANTLARATFRTFEEGKEIRKDNYYLFNVEPNINQNATAFFKQLLTKLIYDEECLVIQKDGQLFIADYWTRSDHVFYEKTYKDIVIGNLALNQTYKESEVLYFEWNNEKITDIIDSLYSDYGKLLASSIGFFKRNNALRAVLDIEARFAQTEDGQGVLEDLFDEQMKRFFEAEGGAVLPLQDGLTLTEIFGSGGAGKRAGENSRDIRAIVDDIFDYVAWGFDIPVSILKGDAVETEGALDTFLMFCIAPKAELIEDEINRKMYKKESYLKRSYMKVDTTMVRYTDITKLANALDKLISSGSHSPNENRSLIDKEPINEDWAEKYYITKNYAETNEYLEGGEGE